MQQILSKMRKAIEEYNMIDEGDKIAVCLSGGKDSITMLNGLKALQRFYPKYFELIAISVNPGFDFFDTDYNHLPFKHGHPNAPIKPKKPKNFDLMKIISEKLSLNLPQIRVDLYEINGNIYFGELTLFHHSGMVQFDPPTWDYQLGELLKLPQKL